MLLSTVGSVRSAKSFVPSTACTESRGAIQVFSRVECPTIEELEGDDHDDIDDEDVAQEDENGGPHPHRGQVQAVCLDQIRSH